MERYEITTLIHPCSWCDEVAVWMIYVPQGTRRYPEIACDVHARQWFPEAFARSVSLAKSTDAPGFRPRHANESGYKESRMIMALSPRVREGLDRNNLVSLSAALFSNRVLVEDLERNDPWALMDYLCGRRPAGHA